MRSIQCKSCHRNGSCEIAVLLIDVASDKSSLVTGANFDIKEGLAFS